jgi:hypothetical protein
MNQQETKEFINVLRACGHEPFSYSNKRTYGKKCIGTMVDHNVSSFSLGVSVALHLAEECENRDMLSLIIDLASCEDSSGYNKVIYFPELNWIE